MKSFTMAAAASVMLAIAPAANAATITRSFEFYATNFASDAPLASVAGLFTVTFDPAANSSGSLDSLTINYPGLQFTAANTGFQSVPGMFGPMTIGGTVQGIGSIATNTSDFMLMFTGAGSDPFSYLPLNFSYSTGTGKSWSGDFQISIARSAGVPEPATWALTILGFGAVGGALRRRKTIRMRYAAS